MNIQLREAAAGILLALASATAPVVHAERGIRVDIGSDNFPIFGSTWNNDTVVGLSGNGSATGTLPFQLNFGAGATLYNFRFHENGFLQFYTGATPPTSPPPAGGNYIAPFAADLSGMLTQYGNGTIDTRQPFVLAEAVPAIRFTWQPSGGGSGNQPTFQIVLLNRASSGLVGDFDLEMNYGQDATTPTPAGGTRSFALGANMLAPISGPFTGATSPDYAFRNGIAAVVPEPSTTALWALGLGGLVLLRAAGRRRDAGADAGGR